MGSSSQQCNHHRRSPRRRATLSHRHRTLWLEKVLIGVRLLRQICEQLNISQECTPADPAVGPGPHQLSDCALLQLHKTEPEPEPSLPRDEASSMAASAALVHTAQDVLGSLARRSQAASWSGDERRALAALSASLQDNLDALADASPSSAVTRARCRAIEGLLQDIGALCHRPEPPSQRLPRPPPLASAATAAASDAARSGLEERVAALNALPQREAWPAGDSERLRALTSSVCEVAAKLAHDRGAGPQPAAAVGRARGRAIDTMLGEVADLVAQHRSPRDGPEWHARTLEWLRSAERHPPPEREAGPAEIESASAANHASAVRKRGRRPGELERSEAVLRRMCRRRKLAVLRAWRARGQRQAGFRHLATAFAERWRHNAVSRPWAGWCEVVRRSSRCQCLTQSREQRRVRACVHQWLRHVQLTSAQDAKDRLAASTAALQQLSEAQAAADRAEREAARWQQENVALQQRVQALDSCNLASTAAAANGSAALHRLRTTAAQRAVARRSRQWLSAAFGEWCAWTARQRRRMEVLSLLQARSTTSACRRAFRCWLAWSSAASEEREGTNRLRLQRVEHESQANRLQAELAAVQETLAATQEELERERGSSMALRRELEQQVAATRRAEGSLAAAQSELMAEISAERARSSLAAHESGEKAEMLTRTLEETLLSAHSLVEMQEALVEDGGSFAGAAVDRIAACAESVETLRALRSRVQTRLEWGQEDLVAANEALSTQLMDANARVEGAAATQSEQDRLAEAQAEQVETLSKALEESQRASQDAEERARAAETEADNTIARIASLAESKIQEAEEAVNVAREHARLKVEEAERVVALAQEEVAAYVEAAR